MQTSAPAKGHRGVVVNRYRGSSYVLTTSARSTVTWCSSGCSRSCSSTRRSASARSLTRASGPQVQQVSL